MNSVTFRNSIAHYTTSSTLSQPDLDTRATTARLPHRLARLGLFSDLERPRQVFEMLTPNWFASVMGTGIVAVAAAHLPEQFPGLQDAAIVVWLLTVMLFLTLVGATATHWVLYPANARRHARDGVMAYFYGAIPMATLTVGAGTLLVGTRLLGEGTAVDVDFVLWTIGTILGLFTAVVVPYLSFTRSMVKADDAFGGWLMPIVPPMVSASTGALLLPHLAPGQGRIDMLIGCYAMFGLSLVASVIVITLISSRLALNNAGPSRMVPTLWIVLGPLGQSITAALLLGGDARLALPVAQANIFSVVGILYSLPVLGFAVLWIAIAGAITVRTAREHLPFSLTWWSFTFPVGTCVTGTSALCLATGSIMLRYTATVLFAGLVAAWVIVAWHTARGAIQGHLFLPIPAEDETRLMS